MRDEDTARGGFKKHMIRTISGNIGRIRDPIGSGDSPRLRDIDRYQQQRRRSNIGLDSPITATNLTWAGGTGPNLPKERVDRSDQRPVSTGKKGAHLPRRPRGSIVDHQWREGWGWWGKWGRYERVRCWWVRSVVLLEQLWWW